MSYGLKITGKIKVYKNTSESGYTFFKTILQSNKDYKTKEVDPKMVYAWHIDNLEIFDKPKELSEFYGVIHYPKGQFITPDICEYGEGYEEDKKQCLKSFKVRKAPQSWQYAWLLE